MENLKTAILRCMIKDARDDDLSHPLYLKYREFIEALIDDEFDTFMQIVKTHGYSIWTEQEINSMTKQTFMNAFFSVDR